MQNKKQVLAFDFGASSGRAILGRLEDGKIIMEEVHRFSNDPVKIEKTMYWDTLRQFYQIKQGIVKAKLNGGFESLGIDTWGVDFGLLDEKEMLLESTVHYRDDRTVGRQEKVFQKARTCKNWAVQRAISNENLAKFGLISMVDYYTERCVTC